MSYIAYNITPSSYTPQKRGRIQNSKNSKKSKNSLKKGKIGSKRLQQKGGAQSVLEKMCDIIWRIGIIRSIIVYLSINRNNLLQITFKQDESFGHYAIFRFVKRKMKDGKPIYDQKDYIAFKMPIYEVLAFADGLRLASKGETGYFFVSGKNGEKSIIFSIQHKIVIFQDTIVVFVNAKEKGRTIGLELSEYHARGVSEAIQAMAIETLKEKE